MEKTHYKIGTRGSHLALTQTLQIKEKLKEIAPEAIFSIVAIKTEGDQNTEKPLWQMDGKDFFTKELDEALLKEEVDLVVHSYKDLGSERPQGIELAAISERKFPNDILLMRKDVVTQLKNKERRKVLVGTSSPRRITNIENFLAPYLPYGESLEITTESLRGNVNTRMQKCLDGHFDALVLALPGIERLAQGLPDTNNEAYQKHGDPREVLSALLHDFDFMVLPTSTFPAAASQGALGIECLESRDENFKAMIHQLNHHHTIEEVKRERALFQEFGGGCHLAVGITVSKGEGFLRQSLRGEKGKKIEELSLINNDRKDLPPRKLKKVFIGLPQIDTFKEDPSLKELTLLKDIVFTKSSCDYTAPKGAVDYFFTSPSAVDYGQELLNKNPHGLWASGTKTMTKLASHGQWVNGCADGLGEGFLQKLRNSHLIEIIKGKANWKVVTNNKVENILGQTIGVYAKEMNKLGEDELREIATCDLYYWSSPSQFHWFRKNIDLNPNALHASGLGKTAQAIKTDKKLKDHQIIKFATMNEFKGWLRNKQ